jgi:hypothetical protein
MKVSLSGYRYSAGYIPAGGENGPAIVYYARVQRSMGVGKYSYRCRVYRVS